MRCPIMSFRISVLNHQSTNKKLFIARPVADVDTVHAARSAVLENALDDVHGGVAWHIQVGPAPTPKQIMIPIQEIV